ncbi:MAG: hypothetical protein ACOYL6_09125 [Bacteriovoracaceae bacterium]
MKNLAFLLALSFSSSIFAGTIKHYNCEAYVNTNGITKFSEVTGVSIDDVEMTLKEKNFTAVNFYTGSIKSQMGSGLAESLLDVAIVSKLEGKAGAFARYDINEYIALLGTNVGVTKLESLTVSGKKGFLQTKKRFAKQLGKEILKQLPNCELEN